MTLADEIDVPVPIALPYLNRPRERLYFRVKVKNYAFVLCIQYSTSKSKISED